jgi:hypothetical protein
MMIAAEPWIGAGHICALRDRSQTLRHCPERAVAITNLTSVMSACPIIA